MLLAQISHIVIQGMADLELFKGPHSQVYCWASASPDGLSWAFSCVMALEL